MWWAKTSFVDVGCAVVDVVDALVVLFTENLPVDELEDVTAELLGEAAVLLEGKADDSEV